MYDFQGSGCDREEGRDRRGYRLSCAPLPTRKHHQRDFGFAGQAYSTKKAESDDHDLKRMQAYSPLLGTHIEESATPCVVGFIDVQKGDVRLPGEVNQGD